MPRQAEPPQRRRRHVVAGQRRLTRDRGVDDQTAAYAPPQGSAPVGAPARPQHTRSAAPPVVPPGTSRRQWRPPRPRIPQWTGVAGLRRALSPTVVAAALLAIVIALATVGALLFVKWENGRAEAKAGPAALAVARVAVPALVGYNYKTLDADFTRAEKYLTGKFLADYKATTEKTVKDAATRYKVTVKADVVAAGVIKVDSPSKVTVLVFADQTVTNTKLKAPRIDRNRVRLDLRKVDGQWRIAALTPL